MKRFFNYLLLGIAAAVLSCVVMSCDKPVDGPGNDEQKLTIRGVILPSSIDVVIGGDVNITGNGFQLGDVIVLAGQETYNIPVKAVEGSTVTFVTPVGFKSGKYSVSVSRGAQKLLIGTTAFNVTVNLSVPDKPGMTIKGVVYCDGVGIPDVYVSDGYEITQTDENGIYYLASEKAHKYVFVILPGDYTVSCTENILPQFFARLTGDANNVEQRDFSLRKVDQDKHSIFVMGDIHVANRISSNNDMPQFSAFVTEAANYVVDYTSKSGAPMYGFTLGDMAWDQFWVSNNFDLTDYLTYAKKLNFPVFHTIGNHDHSCWYTGDWDTVIDYKSIIGPTYYSVNIGKAHYIVLDDIECNNNGTGPDGRYYAARLVAQEVEWVKKDLATIKDKSAPIFVTMHAPIYTTKVSNGVQIAENSLKNANEVVGLFSGFTNVHFLTGHTHIGRNVDKGDLFEHNIPAVCATWWWTGKYSNNQICCDGAPGGYEVFDIDNKEVKWFYKGTGESVEKQFRSYDLNEIHLTPEVYCPKANDDNKAKFTNSYAGEYATKRNDNTVYINVWNWDKEWKVEVTENGQTLDVTQKQARDPLAIISYSAPRLNANSSPSFDPTNTAHMFSVKASSPTSTLEIKVTDRFGNVYTESMKRPKKLELNQ